MAADGKDSLYDMLGKIAWLRGVIQGWLKGDGNRWSAYKRKETVE